MKKLLFTFLFLLPLALFAQADTPAQVAERFYKGYIAEVDKLNDGDTNNSSLKVGTSPMLLKMLM